MSKKLEDYKKMIAKKQEEYKAKTNQVVKHKEQKPFIQMMVEGATTLQIVRTYGKLTIRDIIKQDDIIGFRRLAKQYDEESVTKLIAILIRDTSKAYNKVWSMEKAKELAYEIYFSKYYYLSLEDIYVMFKKYKEKEFTFTNPLVMKHLKLYVDERLKISETETKNKTAQNTYRTIYENQTQKQFKELAKQLSAHTEARERYKNENNA